MLCHEEVKAHVECRFSLFGRFERVLGLFLAKNGRFWLKPAQFWEGTSRVGALALGRHQ